MDPMDPMAPMDPMDPMDPMEGDINLILYFAFDLRSSIYSFYALYGFYVSIR